MQQKLLIWGMRCSPSKGRMSTHKLTGGLIILLRGKEVAHMRRILSLVVVALVMAAMVLVVAMPALTDAKDENADGAKCSEATLDGRYLFSYDGFVIKGNDKVPFASAGYEVYDGNGHVNRRLNQRSNRANYFVECAHCATSVNKGKRIRGWGVAAPASYSLRRPVPLYVSDLLAARRSVARPSRSPVRTSENSSFHEVR